MRFQISQQVLERPSISLRIVPFPEIADVSLTADVCRPCFRCLHDGVVEPDGEEYLTALLTLAFQTGLDFIAHPGASDGMFGQDQQKLIVLFDSILNALSDLVT